MFFRVGCGLLPYGVKVLHDYNHSSDDQILQRSGGQDLVLQKQVDLLQTKIKCARQVKVLKECSMPGPIGAETISFSNRAYIFVDPMKVDSSRSWEWVLSHELSHIRHDDESKALLIGGMGGSSVAIGLNRCARFRAFGVLKTILIGSAALGTFSLYIYQTERRADQEANEVCSEQGLVAGLTFINERQQHHLKIKQRIKEDPHLPWKDKLLGAYAISQSGENRLDVLHPSYSWRKKQIERVLKDRKKYP